MKICEKFYEIWKDNKYTERDVGFMVPDKFERIMAATERLMEDYPESEGYFLKYKCTKRYEI